MLSRESDVDTVGALILGERAAERRTAAGSITFDAVYDQFFSRVWNYVRYRVRSADAADDLTSQIFEKALAKIGSYDPDRGELAVWLFAIARNAVRDHYRAAGRREKFLSIVTAGIRSSTPGPLDEVLRSEQRAELQAAISGLSRRDRDLIGLKFGARLTNRRIATLAGLTESNVGVILYRAIRRLRRELEADNGEH